MHELQKAVRTILNSYKKMKQETPLMKNNKAPGPTDDSIELLKHSYRIILEKLVEHFNEYLKGFDVLEEWKFTYLSSIYKKGEQPWDSG